MQQNPLTILSWATITLISVAESGWRKPRGEPPGYNRRLITSWQDAGGAKGATPCTTLKTDFGGFSLRWCRWGFSKTSHRRFSAQALPFFAGRVNPFSAGPKNISNLKLRKKNLVGASALIRSYLAAC